jgi:aldehyde dehydrogenase (NAD+)
MTTDYLNYIGGQWVPARSGKQFANVNPATGEALGQFPDSGPDDVEAAVTAARGAMRAWRLTPAPSAARCYTGWGADRQKKRNQRAATREMGKILIETRGDAQEGVTWPTPAAGEGRRLTA